MTSKIRRKSSTTLAVKEAYIKIIDGNSVIIVIRDEITIEISKMKGSSEVVPGLGVILIRVRKDSATYIGNKKITCKDVGITSSNMHFPEDSSVQQVLNHISGFNDILHLVASLFS